MDQNSLPAEDSVSGSALSKSGSSSKSRKKRGILRVMLLSDAFEVRGASTQTLVLAEHLVDYGIRASILTPSIRSVAPDRRSKLDVREYPYLNYPLINRIVLRLIVQDYGDQPPHLIHIQSRRMLNNGIRLARQFGIPYLLTIHDYLNRGEMLNFDTQFGRKIIAVSESVKSELLTQPSISSDQVVVIHSGVEMTPNAIMEPILPENRVPVIGTAGPLEQIKGVSYFLQAARIVLSRIPEVEFLVAGSGPEEKNLRQLARELGIDKHVTFVPNLYGFQEALKAMDIFCLPSIKQGLGTIMLEAMALGRPVVASNVGGIFTAIKDNETGFLVPHSDSESLAEKLVYLLQNPEEARKIGEAGRIQVGKNFRIDQSVGHIADLYRSTHADFVGTLPPKKK
ncbi:MAG TPA: glycosyltransferase family 1 protein [Planctomycetaceae bacterium]|nr:glycosyltransferase family 1 protein [Planctomycetaceae bacterium]